MLDAGHRPRCLAPVGDVELQRLAELGRGFRHRMRHRDAAFDQADQILFIIRPPPDIGAANTDSDCTRPHIDRASRLKFAKDIGRQAKRALGDIQRCREHTAGTGSHGIDADTGVLAELEGTAIGQLDDRPGTGASHQPVAVVELHAGQQRQATIAALDPGRRLDRLNHGVRGGGGGERGKQPKNQQETTERSLHRLSRQVQTV